MDKLNYKVGSIILGAATILGGVLPTYAAVDTDFSNAVSSSTSMLSDSKTTIITFIVGVGVIAFAITMSKIAVIVASKWAKRAFAGGKKR